MDAVTYEIALLVLLVVVVGSVASLYFLAKSVNKHVEEALKNANDEEQAEIRKKVVKAVFPPRFH